MLRTTLASSRALRVCVLGLITFTTAITDHQRERRSAPLQASPGTTTSCARATARQFSSIIVDGNSGAVLSSNNPDGIRRPASLTKIMTLYLLFERLDAGKMKLDTEMEVSEHASEQAPTKLGLRPGQTIKVEDAIKGLVTRSANDAAVVIAEAIAGDEDRIRQADDAQGARARHEQDHLSQRLGPAQRRTGHHGARSGDARPRDPGSLSALLPLLRNDRVQLSRPVDPQSQSPARQCRRHRRHQDRLHPRLRLQPRDLDAPRQPPSRRRGDGRPQRRIARRHHAQPAGREPGERRDQAHRRRDHRTQPGRRRRRCRRSRDRFAFRRAGPVRQRAGVRRARSRGHAHHAFDCKAVAVGGRSRCPAPAAGQGRTAGQARTRALDQRRHPDPVAYPRSQARPSR